MRLHRFFVEESLHNKKEIHIVRKDLINQWKNVFRFKPGDNIILFDDSGFEFLCEITLLSAEKTTVSIISFEKNIVVPKKEIYLFCSLIKKDKFEWVLEKGTELGVSHFIPIISERSEKKNLNMDRAKKIITEAVEQSGRVFIPHLYDIVSLKDVFKTYPISYVVFDREGERINISSLPHTLGVLIGPEGGWSESERKLFEIHNVSSSSFGNFTLKSETAAIAAATLFLI
ncbi:MAG: RsmE family RNA methyltransferase [Patescibacteria group bacterium]